MLATLSTPVWDVQGHIQLNVTQDSSLGGDQRRRVTRIATLDGGAVFNNFGFSNADRTITIKWETDLQDTNALVSRLVQLYATAILSIGDGVYLVAIENYLPKDTESTLSLLVTEKLSA